MSTTKNWKTGLRRPRILLVTLLAVVSLGWVLCTGGNSWGKTAQPRGASWFIDMQRYAGSAHGTMGCQECHQDKFQGGIEHPDPDHPMFLKENVSRSYPFERCASCHGLAFERYQSGGHFEAKSAATNATTPEFEGLITTDEPPTCSVCHDVHYQQSGLSRVRSGQRQVEVCGQCHPAFARSYLKNTHGKAAVYLENDKAAYCTDCHGAHHVDALETEEANLEVCSRCHAQAQGQFADIMIHSDLSMQELAGTKNEATTAASLGIIKNVRVLTIVVVILFLVFFTGHTLLSYLREIHEQLRKK